MIGHGVSSRSSHSAAAGRTTSAANSCTQSLTWITSSDNSRENDTAIRPFCARSIEATPRFGEQLYTETYRSVRSGDGAVSHYRRGTPSWWPQEDFSRELLQGLLLTFGPCGQEHAVRDVSRRELEPAVDETWVDEAGNLVGVIRGGCAAC